MNKFDGLVYDYDIEDWVYTKDKSKTKEIIEKLKYEDGKKRFYNTILKPLTTATKANAAKLAKEQKRKYKVGNMINTVTLTVKNKSSHTVTLPRYADCLAGAYCAAKILKPGEIGELGYLGRPCFEATSGKKTTVKPGGSATVKYVSHDEVLQAAEAYATQSSWDGGAGYFDVQSANFFFRSSIVFPTKTSK